MQFNDIDEWIKKGLLQHSEHDKAHAQEAKSRVWAAIEKPRGKQSIHWGFVSALAASLSLFVICAILYLKLESRQEELSELQSQITSLRQSRWETPSIPLPDDRQAPPETHESTFGVAPAPLAERKPITPKSQKLGNHAAEERNDPPEVPAPETVTAIPVPEVNLPRIVLGDLKTELLLPEAIQAEPLPDIKPENNRKLKVKLGNNNIPHDHGHSLALNIKINPHLSN
ncbi:hypothetical protein [Negadavirga shengliensis]|uniref:Uncharacterized protein n=1 Tax=Negadavirga shengliensis TaxID=1389218 RepID=A0ABV9T5Y0_9BACT